MPRIRRALITTSFTFGALLTEIQSCELTTIQYSGFVVRTGGFYLIVEIAEVNFFAVMGDNSAKFFVILTPLDAYICRGAVIFFTYFPVMAVLGGSCKS